MKELKHGDIVKINGKKFDVLGLGEPRLVTHVEPKYKIGNIIQIDGHEYLLSVVGHNENGYMMCLVSTNGIRYSGIFVVPGMHNIEESTIIDSFVCKDVELHKLEGASFKLTYK